MKELAVICLFTIGSIFKPVWSQCTWSLESYDSFEYLTPSPHMVPGSVYHLAPQTFAGCVKTGSRGLYMNIQDGYIGPLYDRPYDVCPGVEYRFSFWTRDAWSGVNDYDINVYDDTGVLLMTVNVVTTPSWLLVVTPGFTPTTSSIRFEIVTNIVGGPGNDIGFDDLKFESCSNSDFTAPPIDLCEIGGTIALHDSIEGFVSGMGGTWGGPSPLAGGAVGWFDPSADLGGTYVYTVPGIGICPDSTASIAVNIVALANVDDSTIAVCDNDLTPIDLNPMLVGAGPGGTWLETSPLASGGFDPLTGSFTPLGVTPGSYEFRYIGPGTVPCPDDTAFVFINVEHFLTAGLDSTVEICNSTGATVDLNSLLNGNDVEGVWEETTGSGAFDPVLGIFDASGLTGGVYSFTYTVTSISPCPDDIADFDVVVNEIPNVEANGPSGTADVELCEGNSLTLFGSGAGVGGTYIWDMGVMDGGDFTQPVGSVTYVVTGTDENGCVGTDSINVTVHPTPTITLMADSLKGCEPFTVNFYYDSEPASATCEWVFGDGAIGTSCDPVVSHTYGEAGEFSVTLNIVSEDGCSNSITLPDLIEVIESPIASFNYNPTTIFADQTTVVFNNESLYSTAYSWDFGDYTALDNSVDPIHDFPGKGDVSYEVILTASNELGCTDTYSQILFIKEIVLYYVPNAFTPDGDAFNEGFRPVFVAGYDPYNFHMQIFNRYGEIVFESYDAGKSWNGSYGDEGLCEDGVYVWRIDFLETQSDKRHVAYGHVVLLK